jgi:hypothetical protein
MYPSSLRYPLTTSFLRSVDNEDATNVRVYGSVKHAHHAWALDDERVAHGIPRALAWDGVFARDV